MLGSACSTAPKSEPIPTPPTPSGDVVEEACSPTVLLPIMKARFDDPATELIIERVDVERCKNGYARVYAVPRTNPEGHPQYDAEQLFLRKVKDEWHVVAEGTGIGCTDADLTVALEKACRALGYI